MKKKSDDVLDLVMMGPSEEEPSEEGGEMEGEPDDGVIAEARSLARELLGLLSK